MRNFLFFLLFCLTGDVLLAQVRPDQTPTQLNPTNANWEFYSQKGGTSLRRCSVDSLGRNFRLEYYGGMSYVLPSGNPAPLRNRLVRTPGDSVFLVDFYGIGFLVSKPGGGGGSVLTTAPIVGNGTSGNRVRIDTTGAIAGQSLVFNGLAWTPSNAGVYVTGSLTGSGTPLLPLNVIDGGITGAKLATNAVDSNKIAVGSIGATDLSTVPLQKLQQRGATNGQLIGWNGTSWAPTTVSSGIGGSISGQQVAFAGSTANTIQGTDDFTFATSSGLALNRAITVSSNAKNSISSTNTATTNADYGNGLFPGITGRATVGDRVIGNALNASIIAGANNQVLNAAEISGTYTTGAFTGTTRNILALRDGGANRFLFKPDSLIISTPSIINAPTLTGSSATPALDISQTWNTTGTPTAINLNVTNTASNTNSNLLGLKVAGTNLFRVDVLGRVLTSPVSFAATSGVSEMFNSTSTFAAGAGSANFRPLSINYTLNNSGAQTGTATGIFLNATENNLNGMTHNLMDLQLSGSSLFTVARNGNVGVGTNSPTAQFTISGSTPTFRVDATGFTGNTYTGAGFTPNISTNTMLNVGRYSLAGPVLGGFAGNISEPALGLFGYTAGTNLAPAFLFSGWKPNGANRTAMTGTAPVVMFQTGLDGTWNSCLMSILANGNVGIGATSPTASLQVAPASAASAPAISTTGSWFTGGTSTTTKPHVLIEPTGTTSTAWNTNGTGLGVNSASTFSGNLIDLQQNGTSRFTVNGSGITTPNLAMEISNIAGYFGIKTRSIIGSPADGIMRLTNYNIDNFERLQFGGTTSSFPALQTAGVTTGTATFTGSSSTITTTTMSPVLRAGDIVTFSTTGTLPAELNSGQQYYVVGTPTATSFQISTTFGGSAITMSGAGTPTTTVTRSNAVYFRSADNSASANIQAANITGVDYRVTGDIFATGNKPTASYVQATGTAGTATVNYGSDLAFSLTFQSGSVPGLTDYVLITFSNPFPAGMKPIVTITPGTGAAANFGYAVEESSKSSSSFRIYRTGGTTTGACDINVHVIAGR